MKKEKLQILNANQNRVINLLQELLNYLTLNLKSQFKHNYFSQNTSINNLSSSTITVYALYTMADSVVAFLLENLSQLLAHEANLLCGVEDRVRSLHNELKLINAFLISCNMGKNKNKSNNNEIEQEVVNQIRDAAHEAEDVIDTFVASVTMHRQRNMLQRMIHGVDHAKLLHNTAQKIDNIKATINEIRDNKVKYKFFQESGESKTREDEDQRLELLHKRRRKVEEDDVVGFVHESKAVIKQLVEEGGSRRNIVSIIGMGGLGKTTLARKVYNNDEVRKLFSSCAWVYVSNDCRVRELLIGLLKCLMPNPEYDCSRNNHNKKKKGKKHIEKPIELSSLNVDELKEMVRICLKEKRYLVVLDDLWKIQDWDEVQDVFPDDNKGSRILITSRLKDVTMHASHGPPYYLQLLNEEDSWKLFSKKVFSCGEECPSDLESLGKQIVKSCRGLPLSIVVLGGLLANKEKSHREWSKVVGHVNWYLTQDETQVKDIVLKLSYDNLPRRLKPCFLYLGIFPEDFEIPVKQLLQLWVAEGFIQQYSGTRYPEDVAEDYLYELIDRSLVQVARMKIGGGVKTCRVHDLLRDLCISESKEGKFFEVYCAGKNDILMFSPTKARRLSIQCNTPQYVSSLRNNNDHSCARSLFCFDFDPSKNFIAPKEGKMLVKGFNLVRVLDIGSNWIGKIPSNLGVLIHLRYLRLDSEMMVRTIPTSICTLHNLQTLDMGPFRVNLLFYFPSKMWKLKQLRHIYTRGPIKLYGRCVGSDVEEVMWNLQTISTFALNAQTTTMIQKGMFPNLNKLSLGVYPNPKYKFSDQLLCLQQLSHLKKLEIVFLKMTYSHNAVHEMETRFGSKPHELLQSLQRLSHLNELKIVNAQDLLRCSEAFPPNITKLTLWGISIGNNSEGVNGLGNLRKLRILRLSGGNSTRCYLELNCVEGSFPQLEVFHMQMLNVLNWKLGIGAMPSLQNLVIDQFTGLDSFPFPSELWGLNGLRQVKVLRPSKETAIMLGHLEMRDGCELIIVDDRNLIDRNFVH